jgi:zinc and cadmium transporter
MNGPTISQALLLAGCSGLILLASLAGGWIPLRVRLTHTRLQVATSFVAGLMLGVGLLHLLPHAWHQIGSIDPVAGWLLGGFLLMFFIQRFFHFHHHDVPEDGEAASASREACEHGAEVHSHGQTLADQSARRLSWTGAALGLTLHTLIDGVALAASVHAESHPTGAGWSTGLATFLVILLHKPFDAMAIGALMAADRQSRFSRHLVNGLFALAIPVGVGLFYLGASRFADTGAQFLGATLAFAAGTFLCIAASDLLPELQFHEHDRVKLSVALLAGLALSAVIGRFESSGHDRHHPPALRQEPAAGATQGRGTAPP